MSSISRVNDLNANMLSLSVLYYTLSFINQGGAVPEKRDSEVFLMIEDYIKHALQGFGASSKEAV